MPQQYYTLEQAAKILQINAEQLKEMARKKEIRAFQDRSGWRFRSQEIDEMARERGLGSDPELPLGEAVKAKAGAPATNEVFNFSLEGDDSDEVPLGKEPVATEKPSSRPGSGARKTSSSKSPPPKASSDSDVRLVLDGSEGSVALDAGRSKAPAAKGPVSPAPKVGSSKSKMAPPVQDDSGVRIVPLDQPSDSDVKIEPSSPHDSDAPRVGKSQKSSDSDIRIEEAGPSGKFDQELTAEIDLDAEQRKAEEHPGKTTRHRPKPGSSPALPTTSPFELSEPEMNVKGKQAKKSVPRTEEVNTDSSSDFELKPMADSSSPLELGSDEVPALGGSDEVRLGEWTGGKGASGISLQAPADSGISLEPEQVPAPAGESDSSSDFELNVPESQGGDSSSDFELSLQEEDASPTEGSSSEFELSLDSEGSSDLAVEKPGSDSDSEFELTLDESGGLNLEEEAAAESDDLDVPSLDDDSRSGAALEEGDTDLESSEFDLSLEGEESGSQVVPLEDEEEYDEGAATVQRKAAGAAVEGEEGLEDLGEALDEDLDETPGVEEEAEPAAVAAAAPPADWGVVFPLISLVSTIVLFFVGLMSFELTQGMWGYHTGNKVSTPIIRFFAPMFPGGDKLPPE